MEDDKETVVEQAPEDIDVQSLRNYEDKEEN